MEDWEFLEVINKNYLYNYADMIVGKRQKFCKEVYPSDIRGRKRAFLQVLWIVYHYGFGCKTFEDTRPYQTEEIYQKLKFDFFLKNRYFFVGIPELEDFEDKKYHVTLTTTDIMPMVLEILFNRASYEEELAILQKYVGTRYDRVVQNIKDGIAIFAGIRKLYDNK